MLESLAVNAKLQELQEEKLIKMSQLHLFRSSGLRQVVETLQLKIFYEAVISVCGHHVCFSLYFVACAPFLHF